MIFGIGDSVIKFYNDLIKDKNHRYKSWEHCFNAFQTSSDLDYLSLHLAFYLASWGMIRGSSGLLWKDYKIHLETVKIIQDKKFDSIRFYSDKAIDKSQIILIIEAGQEISNYYNSIEYFVNSDPKGTISPTDTLITKILLGTLGCVPAYDRLFLIGLREFNIKPVSFNKDSLNCLWDFVIEKIDDFKSVQKTINISSNDCYYPLMKIVDMYFWQVGFDKKK